MTLKANKRPTHSAYLVDGDGKDASRTEIGALWPHEDGHGFNLTPKALPIDGRLVIYQGKAKASKDGARELSPAHDSQNKEGEGY